MWEGYLVRMRWQEKWCISFFSCCWHPFQWLFPKRMEKELRDGRGGPWCHRLSNTFQLLSLSKWIIGWPHRAAPSSQPGPLSPALALTCFMAAPKPHSWSWHLTLLHWQTEDQWGDLPHLACLDLRHQERGFALRQHKWKQTSFSSLAQVTDLQWCHLSTTT